MSQISLKSISGITSITTPAGVDNQFTLHTNNTSQALKLDSAGNLHFNNHVNITGVTTFASNVFLGNNDRILFGDGGLSDAHVRYDGNHLQFGVASGQFRVSADTSSFVNYAGSQTLATINSTGVSIPLDLDVDGNLDVDGTAELDHTNITGIATFMDAINVAAVPVTILSVDATPINPEPSPTKLVAVTTPAFPK